MYKTEAHLHTAEGSSCGKLTAAEMMRLYHEAGVDTVFVSDHFQSSFLNKFPDFTWEQKVDRFLCGYEAAKEAGEKLGMTVLLSAEIRFDVNGNHYLLYGIDRDFLLARPDVLSMTIEEFYPYAKAHGVTVVQAHPYRDGKCFPMPEHVDGLEVYNSNPRHENFDDKTLEVALKHRLLITAGSDAHRVEDVAGALMLSAEKIESSAQYVQLMREGGARAVKMVKNA